tara:strand:+ start:23251 stop:23781 length:531 start_codon:yes stop_codon:yes gene_type:complete
MKLNRTTYFIILVVLAIFYFSCLKGKEVYENFTNNNKKSENSCLNCKSECSPNYSDLCLKTVQSCIDCRNSKTDVLPKSWINIDRNKKNKDDIYELSKRMNPEILVVNQMINTDMMPNSGIQPPMTNIELSAHPNFDKLDYIPRNLVTGMFTETDPVPSNSTLQRKDEIEPKYKTL